jgi:hypothetical protein
MTFALLSEAYFALVIDSLSMKIPPKPLENGLDSVNASIPESSSFNGKSGLLNATSTDVVCRGLL